MGVYNTTVFDTAYQSSPNTLKTRWRIQEDIYWFSILADFSKRFFYTNSLSNNWLALLNCTNICRSKLKWPIEQCMPVSYHQFVGYWNKLVEIPLQHVIRERWRVKWSKKKWAWQTNVFGKIADRESNNIPFGVLSAKSKGEPL